MVMAVFSTGMQLGMGGGILIVHDVMHDYEIPIFIGSGILLLVGLSLHYLSFQLDCRRTGCFHEDCTPKKFKVGRVFLFAAFLYVANLTFFFLTHYEPHHVGH